METVHDNSLEMLREQWRRMSIRADKLEAKNAELVRKLMAERATSVKERIVGRCRRQAVLGFVLIPLGVAIYRSGQVSAIYAAIYAAFGLVMAVLGLMFARHIKATDFISLPTVEALREAVRIRTLQQRFRIFSWVAGAVLIGWFFVELWQPDRFASLIGGCVGLCIGLPIGISKEITNFRLTKQMVAELQADDACEPDELE